MRDFSNYYNKPIPCPYCGAYCYAEFVDVEVGMLRCGPYRCTNCNAYEIGPEMKFERLTDDRGHYAGRGRILNPEDFSDKELETGWFEPSKKLIITCIGCGKTPDEIDEYIEGAKEYGETPTDYCIAEEGTYNKFIKNKFYCTSCYIKAGMPLIK